MVNKTKSLQIYKTFIFVLFFSACQPEQLTLCQEFCDIRLEVSVNDLEFRGCTPAEEEIERFDQSCNSNCKDVLRHMVIKEEQNNVKKCLICLLDNTITDNYLAYLDAKETCFRECNTLGSYQFWYSFYVTPVRGFCN